MDFNVANLNQAIQPPPRGTPVPIRGSGSNGPEGGGEKEPLQDPNSSEQRELQKLKARDAEVRAHEQAHKAAAGSYARGGASFSYQKGPDGRNYAVGGEVQIDASPVSGDPQATIRKMEVVQRAALAPAEPSGQDRAVAAEAGQAIAKARVELAKEQRAQSEGEAGEATEPREGFSATSYSTVRMNEAGALSQGDAGDGMVQHSQRNGQMGAQQYREIARQKIDDDPGQLDLFA